MIERIVYMKKQINQYDLLKGELVTYEWDKYCKDVVTLKHHYMSDVVFLDKIRENAKKLGYIYERSLDIFDFEPERKRHKNPPLYEKFTVFTKIDTEKNEEFPNDKIAVCCGKGRQLYLG